MDTPSDMAFVPGGDIVITDEGGGSRPAVVEVNPNTGARTLISGRGRGSGPALAVPVSVAAEASGDILVANLATGNRTVLSEDGNPTGSPVFDTPIDVRYNACENAFYVLQTGFTPSTPPGKVLKVDATTGARTLFAQYLGAENYSLLLRPLLVLPPGPGGGGGGGTGGGND